MRAMVALEIPFALTASHSAPPIQAAASGCD